MEGFVYFFSRFSTEALLIELILITGLVAAYCVHWILKRRKTGVVGEAVPSGLVRTYLNQLIHEAHLIRTQLFGLLAGDKFSPDLLRDPKDISKDIQGRLRAVTAAPVAPAPAPQPTVQLIPDPALGLKLQELEGKLATQGQAMKGIETDRDRLRKELELLKAQKDAMPASQGGDDLQKKVKELEERLAEYSVIEDDLANLKRLQQENKKLKEALEASNGKMPEPSTVAPANVSPAPAAAEVTKEAVPEVAAEAPEPTPEPAPAPASPEPKATPAPAAAPAVATAPAADATGKFDQLASTVAESIKQTETPAPATEAAKPAAAGEAPADQQAKPKTDDDLLAEFERMLNM